MPSAIGLPEILGLNPVTFKRIARDPDSPTPEQELGFVAQEVREVLPLAVTAIGFGLPDGMGGLDDEKPALGISVEPIVAALVNAIKTLDSRIKTLEAVK